MSGRDTRYRSNKYYFTWGGIWALGPLGLGFLWTPAWIILMLIASIGMFELRRAFLGNFGKGAGQAYELTSGELYTVDELQPVRVRMSFWSGFLAVTAIPFLVLEVVALWI